MNRLLVQQNVKKRSELFRDSNMNKKKIIRFYIAKE